MKILKSTFSLLKKAKKYYSSYNWYKREKSTEFSKISKRRIRELKSNGFNAPCEFIYDFETYNKNQYVTCRDITQLHPLNGLFSKLIDSKLFLPILFRAEPGFLPELYLSIEKGELKYSTDLKMQDLNNLGLLKYLFHCVEQYGEIYIKPVNLSGGTNIVAIRRNEKDLKSKIQNTLALLPTCVVSNRLIGERYSQNIYSESLNTYRVVIYRIKKSTLPKIFRVFHRFGTSYSGNVDNCDKGGMVSEIDIKTGTMGKALIYGRQDIVGRYDKHIDSGKRIEGFQIPDWQSKIEDIRKIVKQLSFLNYAGLDIAPTSKGLKIIEINSLPTPMITQMNSPALVDPNFSQFLKNQGYF